MSVDVEARVRHELREMANRVDPSPRSWELIHRRAVARSRFRHGVRAVGAAAAVVLVAATAVAQPWRDDDAVHTGVAWSADDLRLSDRVHIGPSVMSPLLRVALASDGTAVWYTRMGTTEVGRIDLGTVTAAAPVSTGSLVDNIAISPEAVWAIAGGHGDVAKVDRITGEVERLSLDVAGVGHAATGGITYSDRAVWIPVNGGRLVRIDIETGTAEVTDLGVDLHFVAAGDGAVWGVGDPGTVVRFDPRRREVTARLDLGPGAYRIEHGGGAVWVLDTTRGELVEIAPDLGAQRRIPVGPDPRDLAVGAGAVWVTDALRGALVVVDPGTGEVRRSLELGGRPDEVVVAGEVIWVSDPDGQSLVSVALR